MKMKDANNFCCADFYLCCFLRAKYGLKIVDRHREGQKTTFVFATNGCDIQKAIQDYFNGDSTVNARLFVREMIDLKSLIHL